MKIAVTSHSGGHDFEFAGAGPWEAFKDQLIRLGNRIVRLKDDPEVLIFNNFHPSLYRRYARNLCNSRLVLIAWEPPSNNVKMYRKENLIKFGHTFFPSITWARRYGGHFFPWPQNYKSEHEPMDDWNVRKDKVCMLQGNKWSLKRGENYTLRRKIPHEFEEIIDLFGVGWNEGYLSDLFSITRIIVKDFEFNGYSKQAITGIGQRYKNYYGQVDDKEETLRMYRYSLVVENSNEYVSEKVFDVLRAGTVPIYVGGEFEDTGLDEKMVVRAQPNLSSIKECIRRVMSDHTYAISVRNRGYEVMRDRQLNGHTLEGEFRSLAQKISEALT